LAGPFEVLAVAWSRASVHGRRRFIAGAQCSDGKRLGPARIPCPGAVL